MSNIIGIGGRGADLGGCWEQMRLNILLSALRVFMCVEWPI